MILSAATNRYWEYHYWDIPEGSYIVDIVWEWGGSQETDKLSIQIWHNKAFVGVNSTGVLDEFAELTTAWIKKIPPEWQEIPLWKVEEMQLHF